MHLLDGGGEGVSAVLRAPLSIGRLGTWLDRSMEWGAYALVFALFNPHSTAIRSVGLYLPMLAWLVSLALGRERQSVGNLRQPLALLLLVFTLLVLVSCLQAPDPTASLSHYRKDFADVLLIALPVAAIFRDAERRARLLRVIAFNGFLFAVLDTAQYARELWQMGGIPENIHLHRFYSDGLIFFIPFSLAQAIRQHGWWSRAWLITALWQVLLLFGTGARGAWLGFGVSMLTWFAVHGRHRAVLWLAAGTLAVGAIALAVLPHDLMLDRLRLGADTSERTTGTWGPAMEMMADRPWLGHGFGKEIFHQEFNRQAPFSPWWSIRQSAGPHSSYLEIGFAAGLPALLAMVLTYARFVGDALRAHRLPHAGLTQRTFVLALLGAFVALLLVRGFVETVSWPPLGLLVGALLPLAAVAAQADPKRPHQRPRKGT